VRGITAALDLFVEDCYWRDIVAFTWNVKTMEGKPAITAMLGATLQATRPLNWRVESASRSHSESVNVWFSFTTSVGQGRGHFLLEDGKCRTILTTLQSLDERHHSPAERVRFSSAARFRSELVLADRRPPLLGGAADAPLLDDSHIVALRGSEMAGSRHVAPLHAVGD
jgi:hypothetical protein